MELEIRSLFLFIFVELPGVVMRVAEIGRLAAVGLAGVLLAGCDNMSDLRIRKAADERAARAARQVSGVVEKVQKVVKPTGSLELTLDGPIKTRACYATLILSHSTRPAVLQLTSYENESAETFPSVMIRAEVVAAAPADLRGQSVVAQLFAQTTKDGPIRHTERGGGVELKIVEVSSDTITGEIVMGSVANTDTGQSIDITGKFTAILRAP
jgi:hypothetical protein